ncbi:hypothetical protein PPYR_12422 [Photinus pyralis]|nr:hypothetical protein PPYR_12422 [Photinus pyralis]
MPLYDSFVECVMKLEFLLFQQRADLVIPQEYQEVTNNGEDHPFLRYDSEQTLLPGRMLIFSTTPNLNILARSDKWYADGTFSVVPNLFHQLYTIHVEAYGGTVPVVYALLPNKTKATYRKLLQELSDLPWITN